MKHMTWTAPEFEEIHLGHEIGTHYEDEDDPSFLFTAKTVVRRRPIALERRLQRSRGNSRGGR